MTAQNIEATLTVENTYTDRSGGEPGNFSVGLDLRRSAIKLNNIKYFFPAFDESQPHTLESLKADYEGKTLTCGEVRVDRDVNGKVLPNLYLKWE